MKVGSSKKPLTYNLTDDQLRNTIGRCIDNVYGLLESADRLQGDERTIQYALGLYMYAVEEYGKANLLKSYLTKNSKHFLIPRWIFGGYRSHGNTSHNEKLQEGFKNLPSDCRKLTNSVIIHENRSSKFRLDNIKTPTGSTYAQVMEPYSNGISIFRTHPTQELKFDLKTGCFYIDWDEKKNEPNFIFPAQKGQLLYNIRLMRTVLKEFSLVT